MEVVLIQVCEKCVFPFLGGQTQRGAETISRLRKQLTSLEKTWQRVALSSAQWPHVLHSLRRTYAAASLFICCDSPA